MADEDDTQNSASIHTCLTDPRGYLTTSRFT